MRILIFLLSICYTYNIWGQKKVTLEEQLGNTTIRILSYNSKDSAITGTGFFFIFQKDGVEKEVIVTNKHIIKGKKFGQLIFTKSSASGDPIYGEKIKFDFKKFENQWIFHPDTNVDLCILDMSIIRKEKQPIYYKSIPEKFIPNDSLWNSYTIMEDVIMIGYPKGIIDTFNNIPIVRTGSVSTPPKLLHNGRDEFLIDIAMYNGSSGSPVFLRQSPFRVNTENGKIVMGNKTTYVLLGIAFAMYDYSVASNEIRTLTITEAFKGQSSFERPTVRMPIDLALVIRSQKLNDFKRLLFK
ncbi:MAG: trypsin-like peptidase domain-containing protein [Saprospiraceae bacterium]|nr:trypsin-like peptidase domain-containing protein [Saprospiraceae bacterium]